MRSPSLRENLSYSRARTSRKRTSSPPYDAPKKTAAPTTPAFKGGSPDFPNRRVLGSAAQPGGTPPRRQNMTTAASQALGPAQTTSAAPALPNVVQRAGQAAVFAAEEFFYGTIRNPHTRLAYRRAVHQFLA